MRKEPQIFTRINAQNVPVKDSILDVLAQEEISESLSRQYIRDLLSEEAALVLQDPNAELHEQFSAFMSEYESMTHPNPIGFRDDRYWPMEEIDGKLCLVVTNVSVWDGAIHFGSIQTVPPDVCEGQGFASQVMNTLVNLADKHSVPMSIDPVPFGSEKMGVKELTSWYHRAGFKPDPKYGGELRRQPR